MPAYRIVARRNGFEVGAGWTDILKNSGEEYIPATLSAPEFGAIYGNVTPAPGADHPAKRVIISNPVS